MPSDRRYKQVVPASVRAFEQAKGLDAPDWYLPSAASPGFYVEELEQMFPQPGRAGLEDQARESGNGNGHVNGTESQLNAVPPSGQLPDDW